MARRNAEWYSVYTYGVALCKMAQCNVEWYSVHTNSVALREMAQRNVEWYSVHTNGVELHEMAQRNVEWYSVHTNGAASCRITLQNIRRSIWTLNFLALCEIFRCCGESSSLLVAWNEGYLAETTKNTNRKWNSDLLGAWRHRMRRLPRNHHMV